MSEYKVCIDITGILKAKNQREAIDKLEGRLRALILDMEVRYRYVTLKDPESGDIERLP